MEYKESKEKIYITTDYEGFIFTDWNRDVSNARVVKMVESIKTAGWLPEPVLVNERFEIIDGQSRVKALEKLNMPIYFCIRKGIGRKECQTLNLFQKNWSTSDYINSYIADGNVNYIWLNSMMKKYKELSAGVVQAVCVNKGKPMNGMASGKVSEKVASGSLKVSEEEKRHIEGVLFFLSRFSETSDYLGGRKDTFYASLTYLYDFDVVDNDRVVRVVNNARYDGLVSSGTVEGWLQQIEELYNKHLAKAQRLDLMHEYKVA